jgi:hypothetical protein
LWGDHLKKALDLMKATKSTVSHRKAFPMRNCRPDRFVIDSAL